MMQIHEKIEQARISAGLSQQEMADKLGIGRSTYSGNQLENDLFWAGINNWESKSLELWAGLSKKSNCILDVGANTGVYSLISGAVNPSASIYAFEPLPKVFSMLKRNAGLNNFKIKPFEVAASNFRGVASFFTAADFSYAGSVNRQHQYDPGKMEIKVAADTLDNICAREHISPDLVKMDVERYEPEVIEGFLSYVKKHHPTMLVEVLDQSIGERLRELLKDTKYLYFDINDKTGAVKRMEQLGKGADFNVLMITEERAKMLF